VDLKKKKSSKLQDHNACEVAVRQSGPHWGLFCQAHNRLFKWLNPQERSVLRDIDLPWLVQAKKNPVTDTGL
jgi:hypothetical protein